MTTNQTDNAPRNDADAAEKPEYRVADALRKVALRLDEQLCKGRRGSKIDAADLLETLLAVADELDPH